jgi:F-type H+-transporting ATPase subunit b
LKPLILALVLTLGTLGAQEHAAPASGAEGHGESGGHSNVAMWKWANFAILAGLLGWAVAKNAPPFFQARIAEIQKEINEAKQVRADAEARAAAIEARLANLDSELATLRSEAKHEMESESTRIKEETARAIARSGEQTAQEITTMFKAAENDLRREASRLALELAEKKLKSRMTPEADGALVARFVAGVYSAAQRN